MPVLEINRTDSTAQLGVGPYDIITAVRNCGSHNFHAQAHRLFEGLCHFGLDITGHVMKIINEDDELAPADFLNYLGKTAPFGCLNGARLVAFLALGGRRNLSRGKEGKTVPPLSADLA